MKINLLVCTLALASAISIKAEDAFVVTLFGDRLSIIESDKLKMAVQMGRLTYKTNTGATDETSDIYLVSIINGRPAIVDRIKGGHTPTLQMQDIDADGTSELLLFYHAGANQFVLKVFQIDLTEVAANRLAPISEPLFSNYGYIKIIDGYVVTQNMQRISVDEGKLTTQRYRLHGTKLELVDTQDRKITR